jgi:hypothetical protein
MTLGIISSLYIAQNIDTPEYQLRAEPISKAYVQRQNYE